VESWSMALASSLSELHMRMRVQTLSTS
jgi:hypothetical protein